MLRRRMPMNIIKKNHLVDVFGHMFVPSDIVCSVMRKWKW